MSSWPLERYEVFRTTDLAVAREKVGDFLTPHCLEVIGSDGSLDVRMHSFQARDMSVNLLHYGADVRISQAAFGLNHTTVLVPQSGTVKVRTSGDQLNVACGAASVLSPTEPVEMRWTADCRALILRVEQTALEATLSEMIGEPLDEPLRFTPRMDVGRGRGLSWYCILKQMVEEIDRPSSLIAKPDGVEPFERLLTVMLLKAQPNNYSAVLERGAEPDDRGRRPVCPHYVREARQLLDAHPEWAHTTASLASHVGYTVRTLHKGFRTHLGSSPIAYLRQVRLRRVRDALIAASPDSTTVDAVAQRWGFSHYGHFAGLYRKEFGETPKDTLRR